MSWFIRNRHLINIFIRTSIKPHIQCKYINTRIFTILANNQTHLPNVNLEICRHKHKKGPKKDLTESEDDDEDFDDWDSKVVDKQTKLLNVKVNSLRADLVLKSGLGIARNKIETMFYESKIRVNGRKLLKKSVMLNVGDEIDVVKGASPTNPDFLIVARVEILSASERSEGLNVKLRRNKTLTIENYEGDNTWK